MASPLLNIVKKELKEILRDPRLTIGMILVPLIMFPLLGTLMSGMFSGIQEQAYSRVNVVFVNLDEGNVSELVLNDTGFRLSLMQINVSYTVYEISESGLNAYLNSLYENTSVVGTIVIPQNFSYCIYHQRQAVLRIYIPYRSSSMFQAPEARVMAVVDLFKRFVSAKIIEDLDPEANPVFVQDPISTHVGTVYKGEILENVSPSLISGVLLSKLIMLPIALMMILVLAVQFAAITVASEKEQKTLETLLTLPIDRTKIVLGKLTGSIVVAVFGTIGFGLGFQYYMTQISSTFQSPQGINVNLRVLSLTPSLTDYLMLVLSVFLSLIAILSLTVIFSAFAEDVRTAQSMIGILVAPITILPIIAIFAVLSGKLGDALGFVLLMIPFSSPMVAPIYIFQGQTWVVAVANLLIFIQTIFYFKLAAWFYSSERILTAKISFRRKRREETT